jgi:hypothetical protein
MIKARLIGLAVVALGLLFAPVQALADWRRAESEHFIIYSDRSEASLREYVVMLEDFDALLRWRHPSLDESVVPPKLEVYLVGNVQQLRRAWPAAPDRVAGFYSASYGGIFAVAVRDAGGQLDSTSGDDVVLHEYVHHFMHQYHKAAYPAWLVEGYAEYYATADLTPKRIVVGNVNPGRAYALRNPAWLDMADVLSKRVGELSTSDKQGFYAQSWLLTHYIMSDTDRRRKFDLYLREWRANGDSIAAWKKAFGEDPQALRRSLDRYRNKDLMGLVITRDKPSAPPMTITTLSEGANDVLLENIQLQTSVAKARQADLLQRMRSAHARRPNDRFTRLAVARAETKYGDRKAGEAILKTMIADDPNDYEAMLVLAESHLLEGRANLAARDTEFAAARSLLASVMRLRPEEYRLYVITAQTRVLERGTPSENTLNVLARAVQLAPQVRDLRMMAAVTYMRANADKDEIRHFLEPLLSDPHGGRLTTQAQEMIARLDGQAPPATSPADAAEAEGEEEGDS